MDVTVTVTVQQHANCLSDCPTVRQRACNVDAVDRGDNNGVGDSAGNTLFSS